jgi:capsid protein
MADSLSADAAASSDVRKQLRQRARYEVANNSYAKGIVLTLANDCVGTGPRLQVLTADNELNKKIELAFSLWSQRISLAAKLRTMRMSKSTDGETFGILTGNGKLPGPVKLDLSLVEADRVTTPYLRINDERMIDGVILDTWGNPAWYKYSSALNVLFFGDLMSKISSVKFGLFGEICAFGPL